MAASIADTSNQGFSLMGSIDPRDSTLPLLNRLRMRQVALLLAIDENHTLRAAADYLGMTQPAGTKMLRELEDTLGLTLFDRVGNSLQINAAGRRVAQYFRHLRGQMEALNCELHELRQGGQGRLAVGSIMAASPGRLTQTLLALKQRWPQLSMEIAVDTSDRLLAQLEQGVLEVVIGRPLPDGQGNMPYTFRSIHDEALSVIAGRQHPLAGRQHLDFADLQDYGWVLQPAGSPMRTLIDQEFAVHHMPQPRGLIETGSILTTMSLVRHSHLLAMIPQVVAQEYATHGMIAVLDYTLRHTLETYGSLIRQDRPLSHPASQFLALLHGDAQDGALPAMA